MFLEGSPVELFVFLVSHGLGVTVVVLDSGSKRQLELYRIQIGGCALSCTHVSVVTVIVFGAGGTESSVSSLTSSTTASSDDASSSSAFGSSTDSDSDSLGSSSIGTSDVSCVKSQMGSTKASMVWAAHNPSQLQVVEKPECFALFGLN